MKLDFPKVLRADEVEVALDGADGRAHGWGTKLHMDSDDGEAEVGFCSELVTLKMS